ncbi:MAG: methyltransferase [Mycobacteriales bacterium]
MAQQRAARARLDAADLARLDATVDFIRTHDTDRVLAGAVPGLDAGARAAVAAHCRFGHAAVLVFPSSVDGLRAELRERGLHTGPPGPSVVVRDRLSARYGRPRHGLEVAILRAPVTGRDGAACEVEVFAVAAPPGSGLAALAAAERAGDHEAHVALAVPAADHVVLSGLRAALVDRGGMTGDGGGYNRHENSTVLYFRGAGPRLELIAAGEHAEVLAVHRRRSGQPAERLLRLMTGAWTTQAIAVAAELRLADHLSDHPDRTTTRLAGLTGADPDSLRRLLRYLASLGVVVAGPGDTYALTDLGLLLRTDAEHSLHPLALLYGGAFYESFGQLAHAVRTGREGFDHLFGAHHFEYFSARPALAELFDRAMAAGASIFGTVAEVVDLTAARTVVDVAGGNGELLGHLLRAAPHLRGVLLERPGVIEAARATLAAAGCADRCELVAGDFTAGVPAGGDVYLLSRVLHDWDDQQCRTILKRCADAMRAGAELLVLERLLPEDGTPAGAAAPLAVAWDLHMLCNVGGRERTAGHYRRLLAEAGFEIVDVHDLPLEVALLRARRVRA